MRIQQDRRRFVNLLCGTFAAGSAATLVPQLGLIPRAMAQSTGYRALVCVYLAGANDSFNLLVPRDSESAGSRYDTYRSTRGGVNSSSNSSGLALAFNSLLPVAPANQPIGFGLHPACADFTASNGGTQAHSGLKTLFDTGKLAFVANVGPLINRITRDQYEAGAPRPAQLFSHNDQELLWQLGLTDATSSLARYGWGGRLARAGNFSTLSSGLSSNISLAGSARFLVGDGVMPYQLTTRGIDLLDQYSQGASSSNFPTARRALLNDLLDDAQAGPYGREYAAIFRRSLSVGESLFAQLEASTGQLSTIFPNNDLANQLKMVARLIKLGRNSLGAQRQVYFVRMGGFDLHDGMFTGGNVATTGHGALLTQLNQALGAFWTAMGEVGAQNDVTAFTMSDFGRTLTGNGNGSDHAWGGNQLVLGGQVNGNRIYGTYPQLRVNANNNAESEWSFSRGQYIPTTAVDQMAATLSKWMGVTSNANLDAIFPNLPNFGTRDLGFMQA